MNRRVDVPTTATRFVIVGEVTSAPDPVVKETGDVVVFPAASRERTTAKYVVLVLRFVSWRLWLVIFRSEDTTWVAVALVFTGREVEKKTALSAASFVFQVTVAVVVAGVTTIEEIVGATVSVVVPVTGGVSPSFFAMPGGRRHPIGTVGVVLLRFHHPGAKRCPYAFVGQPLD